ncbi:MAG TPA: L,D-transpeptidase family protein [Sporolactobacillaceae bacterium]|nr:L,D-transpeptidase family protein [Sporolactobacillaceae bacterium]
MRKRTIVILSSIAGLVVLLFCGMAYYQCTRFNATITINDTKVGGLTAEQALTKLKTSVSKNTIFMGQKVLYDGKDTKMGFTNQDLDAVKMLLKKQWTLFPSSKTINYSLKPSETNQTHIQTMAKKIEEKLQAMNKQLKAPKNAEVYLVNGKIVVSKAKEGTQYDLSALLKEYREQAFNSEVHLKPVYLQPLKATSSTIKLEKAKLEALQEQTVDYKLQDKVYPFKGRDVIQNASLSNDMKVLFDSRGIKKKLSELNRTLSTLNKNYTFKTHSGTMIAVKGATYGWAINVDAEAKRIKQAFEKEQPSILAYNIYGAGWNINGVGYHTPSNHGIGDTYVEVSIEQQRIWVYKNGQLKVTTHVVTGTHAYNEDTPKGVWYIEYKQSPSILTGSEVGNPNYSVKVNYWAPFTLSGCGFHDASWRNNWSSQAYLNNGSGGCINTPPSVMKAVYDNLTQYEPVVIY